MQDMKTCEKIEIPQGEIYLGKSTKEQSVGYLKLNPRESLTFHHRPAIEKLTQVKGKCDMLVYDEDKGKIITLNEGDKLVISPEGTWHIHANPYNKPSLTYFDFEGDVTDIIEEIGK